MVDMVLLVLPEFPYLRQEKGAQRLSFGVRRPPGGWGSSTRRGGGRKVRALPRKFVFLGFGKGGTWDVLGILPGCPGPLGVFKKFVPKKFVAFFVPLYLVSTAGIERE